MRKDHEGFCFPRFSYGIINILLTSSQRIIPSQAWHNSCSWPPASAEHPGNKFRLPERKKKSILQLILGGGGGVGWWWSHPGRVNITRSPKEEIKEKVSRCHSTHQFGTNGQMTTIPASLCLKLELDDILHSKEAPGGKLLKVSQQMY